MSCAVLTTKTKKTPSSSLTLADFDYSLCLIAPLLLGIWTTLGSGWVEISPKLKVSLRFAFSVPVTEIKLERE